VDICLINPPTTRKGGSGIYFPMSLLALASYLDTQGFSSRIVDYDLDVRTNCISSDHFIKAAVRDLKRNFSAKTYGITTVTSNFALAILMAEEIKRQMPKAAVVLGGPQVSSVPRTTLERFPFVDAVVVGEGECTLAEYLGKRKTGNFRGIPGLMVRDHLASEIPFVHRELQSSLDIFPPADFSKVRLREYEIVDRLSQGYFLPFIEAGRGCPFDCTFCSTSVMWGRRYRVKSPRRIYQELAALRKKYGYASFELIHDNFTTSRKYLQQFCHELIEMNHVGVQWGCASRVDTLHVEDLDLMAKAGCDGVFFGVETGSQRMQKVIKKEIDLSDYSNLLSQCLSRGFRVNLGFILGFPEEDEEDIDATVRCALDSKLKGVAHPSINRLRVLAETQLHRENQDKLEHFCDQELIGVEDERCRDLAKKYPDLFSSFYSLPHPKFSQQEVEEMANFFQFAVNLYFHHMDWAMNRKGLEPIKLFQYWMKWKNQNTDPSMPPRSRFTELNFERFWKDTVLPAVAMEALANVS